VIFVSVCVFVCLSACIISKTTYRNFVKFSVHVTRDRGSAFSDKNAIRYVLPVLWMTSCSHIMAQIRIQAVGELFIVTRQVALLIADPGTKSAIAEKQRDAFSCFHRTPAIVSDGRFITRKCQSPLNGSRGFHH